jgi:sterol desaturase/sphingolipid hydroxylase (fatty acid hydroxylase superfamily)
MATTMKRSAAIRGDVLWATEARKGRARLYPVTAFYTAACLAVLVRALRGTHVLPALGWAMAGVLTWTLVEYLTHRYVLHGRFPDGPGLVRHFLHVRFDHLHWEHHERPWDAKHINGRVQDTLPFVAVFAAMAAVFPFHTGAVFLAAIVQCYVIEEWVHHSVHFYHFRNPYFRYIRKHHLFHHSPRGSEIGYGLTNGFWDIVLGTRIPEGTRRALYGRQRETRAVAADAPADAGVVPTEVSWLSQSGARDCKRARTARRVSHRAPGGAEWFLTEPPARH